MKHPTNKRERIKLKHLKDEVKASKTSKPNKVWRQGLESLKDWETRNELREYTGQKVTQSIA